MSRISTITLSQPQKEKGKQFSSLNIYIIGPLFTGKSSIIHRLLHNEFNPNPTPTSRQHFEHTLRVPYPEPTDIKLNIQDLGGSEKYEKLRVAAIEMRNWNKVEIIVYDVGVRGSFEGLGVFVEEWNKNVGKEHVDSIILVANKIDLEKVGKRVVTTDEGLELARKYNLIYQQCTSKQPLAYIFEAAYYLKCLQSKKQTLALPYIYALNDEIASIQKQYKGLFKIESLGKVREDWENRMALLLYQIGRKINGLERELGKSYDRALGTFEDLLAEMEGFRDLGREERKLEMIGEMIKARSNPIQQEQQQPLATNSINPSSIAQKNLQKLQQSLQHKKSRSQALLLSKIDKELQKMGEKSDKVEELFKAIEALCRHESISKFVDSMRLCEKEGVNADGKGEEQIVRANSLSEISNTKQLGFEQQTKALMTGIQRQYKGYQQFGETISVIHIKYSEFISTLKQQYHTFKSDSQAQPYISQSETLEQLLIFYLQQNKKPSPSSIEAPSSNTIYIRNKVKLIREKYYECSTALCEEYKGVLEGLRMGVIGGLGKRRRLKILKHQTGVFKYWLQRNMREAEEEKQRGETGFAQFFNKLFK